MTKTFTVAGTSNLNGVVKYRVANSLKRDAILKKSGHTEIKLVELPTPMSKEDAFEFIAQHPDFAAVKPTVKGGIEPKAKPAKAAKKAA